jgi:E3 ubiquitin-protein ligase HUWE1
MACFIHNEPTSLTILQEAKIPQTLLESLSKDIPVSTDVVMSIPGAFGAICLNVPGLEMFKDFKLKTLFSIFTSEPHVRAFQDGELASNLGMSVDELVRHQPTLKSTVMSEINTMLEEVLDKCSAQRISAEDLNHCSLQKTRRHDAPAPGEVTGEDNSRDDKESLIPMLVESSTRVGCVFVCASVY